MPNLSELSKLHLWNCLAIICPQKQKLILLLENLKRQLLFINQEDKVNNGEGIGVILIYNTLYREAFCPKRDRLQGCERVGISLVEV